MFERFSDFPKLSLCFNILHYSIYPLACSFEQQLQLRLVLVLSGTMGMGVSVPNGHVEEGLHSAVENFHESMHGNQPIKQGRGSSDS